MAASVGTGESTGGKRKKFGDNAEINVTPFVDVMLVLLIIFMVAAPLATVNIKLDLPPPDADPKPQLEEPVFVSLQDTGQIFVGTTTDGEYEANWFTFRQVLNLRTNNNFKRKIFIRADQKVQYADVMKLMDEIQGAGYKDLALVAEEVVD